MKVSRSTFETQAFVLTWASLEKLYASIAAQFPKLLVSAKCVDQLDREFSSIEELKAFDNPARAAIIELRFTARNPEHDQRLMLSLSSERSSNVRISLDADEEVGYTLNALANDTVESLRPWYAWIARADWYWVVFGGWMATQILLIVLKLALAGDKVVTFSGGPPVTSRELLRGILISFVPLAAGLVLNKLRNRFFPMGVFAIGQGELRHTSREVTRTVLIAGAGVSIVTGIGLSWFA